MNTCIQCQSSFSVSPAEQKFLREKIDMVDPVLCPSCRRQWRFAWRNERTLYHRTCDLTGKKIISIYAPNSPYKVYDQNEWHTDKWNALDQGRKFDFSRGFFEQYDELIRSCPKISMFTSQNENSDFTNGSQQNRNCYMIFVSDHNEDCYYSYAIDSCRDCMECLNCYKCELCIECIDCSESYHLAFSEKSHTCRDSFFLSDCKGCNNCFGCFGLRSKSYCIFNEQHSREEYEKKLSELNTGNRNSLLQAQKIFEQKKQSQQIHQYYDGNNNENVTGDHIVNCRNCTECYDSGDLEDCGYLIFSYKSRDCYDGHVVVDNSERCYGTISTISQYNTQFTFCSYYSRDSMYLDHCQHCSNCFGCSALTKERFCIFNKQYKEEEYYILRDKIIEHMKKTGEWGSPLPPSLSPFGYNETAAQEYYPLTQTETDARGWKWYIDPEESAAYRGPTTTVPVDIANVPENIIESILLCEKTGKPFKVIPQELKLYRTHHLPLPTANFDSRHLSRIARRNPRTLWTRTCDKCGAEVETTYSPERPEKIYCEKCYLEEMY